MSAKQKKKRNKKYHGADARATSPLVTRVSAEERSRTKEWWLTYKQLIRVVSVIAGIITAFILLVVGIIGLF